jgi:hypothetical protein
MIGRRRVVIWRAALVVGMAATGQMPNLSELRTKPCGAPDFEFACENRRLWRSSRLAHCGVPAPGRSSGGAHSADKTPTRRRARAERPGRQHGTTAAARGLARPERRPSSPARPPQRPSGEAVPEHERTQRPNEVPPGSMSAPAILCVQVLRDDQRSGSVQ